MQWHTHPYLYTAYGSKSPKPFEKADQQSGPSPFSQEATCSFTLVKTNWNELKTSGFEQTGIFKQKHTSHLHLPHRIDAVAQHRSSFTLQNVNLAGWALRLRKAHRSNAPISAFSIRISACAWVSKGFHGGFTSWLGFSLPANKLFWWLHIDFWNCYIHGGFTFILVWLPACILEVFLKQA